MYEKQGVSDVSSILLASRHVVFHGRNMFGWDARLLVPPSWYDIHNRRMYKGKRGD